ncbi:E3 ubiquitin-protein ligase DDB_G0292642-like [Rhinoraja longicauda]
MTEEKRYDPNDSTLKFVQRRDEITGDDDPNVLRVEMSCGHAVDPTSLTGWCRSLIDSGHSTFHCPAAKDGTKEKCNKEWPYLEVRRHALLTDEEQKYFEEKVALLAASKYCEFSTCPGCQNYIERKDLTNLSVRCSICTAQKGKCYEFCWQCSKQWKGRAPRSDRCDNEGCTNIQQDTLKNCDMKTLSYSKIQCPKIRACPTCGITIEHKDLCKYIQCIRCHVEFCFACLKTKAVCEGSSSYSAICANPVAPRQTSIPTWNHTPNTTIPELNHMRISSQDDDHHHSTNNENSSCPIL